MRKTFNRLRRNRSLWLNGTLDEVNRAVDVHMIERQATNFRDAEAVSVGQQQQAAVPLRVPAAFVCALDQAIDLAAHLWPYWRSLQL